jgi:rubrerythrin
MAGQRMTQDPGAIELMKELAAEEAKHYAWIKDFKDRGTEKKDRGPQKLPDLMVSDYLLDINFTQGAGLQDVITIALKREQSSVEFYEKMQPLLASESARRLCGKLLREERKHKRKLEIFYDDLFFQED